MLHCYWLVILIEFEFIHFKYVCNNTDDRKIIWKRRKRVSTWVSLEKAGFSLSQPWSSVSLRLCLDVEIMIIISVLELEALNSPPPQSGSSYCSRVTRCPGPAGWSWSCEHLNHRVITIFIKLWKCSTRQHVSWYDLSTIIFGPVWHRIYKIKHW